MNDQVKDWENRKELGHEQWWDMYVDNLDTADLEEICHQVLDLYIQQPTPAKDAADSPPQPGTSSPVQTTISTLNSGATNASTSRQQPSQQVAQGNESSKVRQLQLINVHKRSFGCYFPLIDAGEPTPNLTKFNKICAFVLITGYE